MTGKQSYISSGRISDQTLDAALAGDGAAMRKVAAAYGGGLADVVLGTHGFNRSRGYTKSSRYVPKHNRKAERKKREKMLKERRCK